VIFDTLFRGRRLAARIVIDVRLTRAGFVPPAGPCAAGLPDRGPGKGTANLTARPPSGAPRPRGNRLPSER
jgi:hypothetical protein